MVLRILIKTCTPLLTGALKSMMEAQSQTNYITHDAVSTSKRDSTVKWWGAGLGGLLRAAPRGGVRPGFEKGLETGRYIIICGGKRDSDNATVPHTQIYDRMSGHWEPGPDMLRPRVSARAVVLHGELYVVGGWDGRAVLQSVERLDVSIGRFVRVSDMNIARASPALAVLDGFLYAIGGFDGNDWLRDVERYDPGKDAWQVVAPLSAPRSAFGSCAINGSILAIGGSDGHMSQRTVERYNPQTNRWTSMPGLTTRRENLGVAVFDDQVYAAGGFDSMWAEWLCSAERYDSSICAWVSVADLRSARRNCMLINLNGDLLAIGGNDGVQHVQQVERFGMDAASRDGSWRALDLFLPTPTSYFACAAS